MYEFSRVMKTLWRQQYNYDIQQLFIHGLVFDVDKASLKSTDKHLYVNPNPERKKKVRETARPHSIWVD
jgi:hypothetical protein